MSTMLTMLAKPTTPCASCVGRAWSPRGDLQGYVPAGGTGANGVLIVDASAGEAEEASGVGFTDRPGYYLFTALAKVGLEREDFRYTTVLSCRPPTGPRGRPLLDPQAVDTCDLLLTATIEDMRARCADAAKHLTILALGPLAFRRVMGLNDPFAPILKEDYANYVHWSDRHHCWVIATDPPSLLMQGNHYLVPQLQCAAMRAVEVATDGFAYDTPTYIEDPSPSAFAAWAERYLAAVASAGAATGGGATGATAAAGPVGQPARPQCPLSVDIETPRKQKARGKEDTLTREEEDDYIILRCSFGWEVGEAVSIPWRAEYMPTVERLLMADSPKVFWNYMYDVPRLKEQVGMRGDTIDAMLAWHVLNSQLEKRLGLVAPFYAKRARMWKHLSGDRPAAYNAQDADMALVCYEGIKADLERAGQWHVFERHVIELNRVLDHMSAAGVLRDEAARTAGEARLTTLLVDAEGRMDAAVPLASRRLKVFKGLPPALRGLSGEALTVAATAASLTPVTRTALVPRCPGCRAEKPKAAHFKPLGVKRTKAGEVNPCAGLAVVKAEETVQQWAKVLPFKPSKLQLTAYQTTLKQRAIVNRREQKTTFDEDAIRQLMVRYPKDALYPVILEHRKYQMLRSRYVGVTQPDGRIKGGLEVGRDGRIHTTYSHNPETLRLASQNPAMQNLPRMGADGALENIVRNLIVAAPGHTLIEFDFSAIESVLVAYDAKWPDGIRLAKLGMHSFLASHVLKRPADLTWSDDDLRAYFKEIKKSTDHHIQLVYAASKRCSHLSAYGGSPRKMHQAEPEVFTSVKYAKWLQDIYWEVAAPVRRWQLAQQMLAHEQGYLRNAFDYVLRFTHVFRFVREGGAWVRKPGDQINDVLAFVPQSTAAGIIKEVMLTLYADDRVRPYMRLQVHDSLVFEVPLDKVGEVSAIVRATMEAPIRQLPLPASYAMGTHLTIGVDGKQGARWGMVS